MHRSFISRQDAATMHELGNWVPEFEGSDWPLHNPMHLSYLNLT